MILYKIQKYFPKGIPTLIKCSICSQDNFKSINFNPITPYICSVTCAKCNLYRGVTGVNKACKEGIMICEGKDPYILEFDDIKVDK